MFAASRAGNLEQILANSDAFDSGRAADLRAQARAFAAPFVRENGVFHCIRPLLVHILKQVDAPDGGRAERLQRRTLLERAMCAGRWHFESADGRAPPTSAPGVILAGTRSPDEVSRNHCDYVVVDISSAGQRARASIVGTLPFQLRQLSALLMGARALGTATATPLRVQVLRNIGHLLVRSSSDSTVLQSDGRKRQCKQTSPLQLQGDFALNGELHDRATTSFDSRRAFDGNFKLLFPLFLELQRPMPHWQRYRGAARPADELHAQ